MAGRGVVAASPAGIIFAPVGDLVGGRRDGLLAVLDTLAGVGAFLLLAACSVGRAICFAVSGGCAILSLAWGTWRLSCGAVGAAGGGVALPPGLTFTAALLPADAGAVAAWVGAFCVLGRPDGCACAGAADVPDTAAAVEPLLFSGPFDTGVALLPGAVVFGRLTG